MLMTTFSEKVVEQNRQIEVLHETAENSVSNVKEARIHLHKATQSSVGTRVMIMLTLVIAGLSLLFLDWYES